MSSNTGTTRACEKIKLEHSNLSCTICGKNAIVGYCAACDEHTNQLCADYRKEINSLRTALEAMLTSEFFPGYVSINVRFDVVKRKDETHYSCTYCPGSWENDESEHHRDGCPVKLAQEVLGEYNG